VPYGYEAVTSYSRRPSFAVWWHKYGDGIHATKVLNPKCLPKDTWEKMSQHDETWHAVGRCAGKQLWSRDEISPRLGENSRSVVGAFVEYNPLEDMSRGLPL
jgi:hypothetical protein